MADDGRGG